MSKLYFSLILVIISTLNAAEHPQLKAFPEAAKGKKRIVIVLPHKERGEENNFTVELIPGKTMLTDGVNRVRLGTSIASKPLKGWGYTLYEVTGQDVAMSTLIAAPRGKGKKVETFVLGAPLTIRYNSRLPIVIYVPIGQDVRYRIWSTGKFKPATKG
jgi:ecotin